MYADVLTTDTTWTFQLRVNGEWQRYSQAEFRTEQDCRAAAATVYGGTVESRILKISREVMQ